MAEDRRIFTPLARSSYKWEREYDRRTAVERVNSRIDVVFGFEISFRAIELFILGPLRCHWAGLKHRSPGLFTTKKSTSQMPSSAVSLDSPARLCYTREKVNRRLLSREVEGRAR